jgi:hypothetical protein
MVSRKAENAFFAAVLVGKVVSVGFQLQYDMRPAATSLAAAEVAHDVGKVVL